MRRAQPAASALDAFEKDLVCLYSEHTALRACLHALSALCLRARRRREAHSWWRLGSLGTALLRWRLRASSSLSSFHLVAAALLAAGVGSLRAWRVRAIARARSRRAASAARAYHRKLCLSQRLHSWLCHAMEDGRVRGARERVEGGRRSRMLSTAVCVWSSSRGERDGGVLLALRASLSRQCSECTALRRWRERSAGWRMSRVGRRACRLARQGASLHAWRAIAHRDWLERQRGEQGQRRARGRAFSVWRLLALAAHIRALERRPRGEACRRWLLAWRRRGLLADAPSLPLPLPPLLADAHSLPLPRLLADAHSFSPSPSPPGQRTISPSPSPPIRRTSSSFPSAPAVAAPVPCPRTRTPSLPFLPRHLHQSLPDCNSWVELRSSRRSHDRLLITPPTAKARVTDTPLTMQAWSQDTHQVHSALEFSQAAYQDNLSL